MADVIELGRLDADQQAMVREVVQAYGRGSPRLCRLIRRECTAALERNAVPPGLGPLSIDFPHPFGLTPEQVEENHIAIQSAIDERMDALWSAYMKQLLDATAALCVERVRAGTH